MTLSGTCSGLEVLDSIPAKPLAKHKNFDLLDENWFYTGAASTARRLYLHGGAGIGSLTKIYGGLQRNGVKPSHFSRAVECGCWVLKPLEGTKMEKDKMRHCWLTPQEQNMGQIARLRGSCQQKH
ncbi:40S ribosomal protein S19-like [Rattus rattus]|uniref:40S ribosomal protein S19-like n=1 Tax=Rattus rattus TaxID=10117 RepID=UPI0013F35A7F|nr:40S ribosomal protein S19-like [Rattus rattus]